MCIFYRVRVAIDIDKPLKKHMKLKKDNGSWAFIDFRYERLPTFCFRCGLIGHGDHFCPKIAQGYDPKAEKPYGAWMRLGTRRTMPTSGQRWVALESNADRLNWRSPAMESDKGEGVYDGGNMGAAAMQMVTSTNVLIPVVNANHANIPATVLTEQKRCCTEDGEDDDTEQLREEKCREIVTQSWERMMGLDVFTRIEHCGNDIWRWGRTYNKDFQRRIDNCLVVAIVFEFLRSVNFGCGIGDAKKPNADTR
nr:uncharacterized protein LOC109174453 [Ipomoea batatas]